ncbi:MAG: tetratricopeptide repeat protein [Bacteroidales bacterium]|nr:tetratricopeptide repeat protein [Bacteroidales bacterium]
MKGNSNIFDISSGCIRQDVLLKYLKGELSGMERNLVEKHLLECEMCSDELEGLTNLSEPERIAEIEAELNSKVDQRTSPRIFWLNPKVVYRVAAVAVLTIGVSTLLYYFVLKTAPSTMMSESQMPSTTAEMNDSTAPLEVIAIPKDATERSESQKKESKSAERPATPTIVADNIKVVEDIFIDEDSESVVLAEAEMEDVKVVPDVTKSDSAFLAANEVVIAGQQADALRAASVRAKEAESTVVAKDAKLSRKSAIPTKGLTQHPTIVESALDDYNQKSYQKALDKLNALYGKNAANDTVAYYRAMCLYNLKTYAKAIDAFQELTKNVDGEFFYDSQWYCALSLIEVGRVSDAVGVLNTLVKDQSKYRGDAEIKLNEIQP